MRKITIDGQEWFVNRFGVIFRFGNEDVIRGYQEVIFR